MDKDFYQFWEGQRYQDGVSLYRHKVAANDQDVTAKEGLILFLFMAGYRNKIKGAIVEAVSLAKKMALDGEGVFGVNIVIGLEKSRRMGFEESIENYRKALAATRDNGEKRIALTRLAASMTLSGKAKEAEGIIKEIADIGGVTPLVQYLYVNTLRQQGKFKESIKEYDKLKHMQRFTPYLEYWAATLKFSRPNAAEIGAPFPVALFLLLLMLHSIFQLISLDVAVDWFFIIMIIGAGILFINVIRVKRLN